MLMDIVDILIAVIDTSSVLVILGGFSYAIVMFVSIIFLFGISTEKGLQQIGELRRKLGVYLLFALELLIAWDIIQTVIDPTYEILIQLGGIVLIRTVISYFLEKEVSLLVEK